MTTTKQPEALRLADQIEAYANAHPMSYPVCNIYAADKLRYQHALLIELADQLSGSKDRIAELEAARIAYASEFEPGADGVPDVGNIHANIRALKAQLSAIGAGGVEPLRGSRHAHECREALAACIKLLKKTPKITRDIYVGKDRQAWGVQAQAVLDAALAAALAALNQEDEK